MAFGEDFLRGFFGSDGLRDYRHASKTFRTNGYGLSPRPKFLFHVSFNLNHAIPKLNDVIPLDDQKAYSLLVKTVSMPAFDMNVEELNQYNRRRYVQTKMQYQPIDITFHDDTDDLIRNLWYNYYSYYYKDPSQRYDNLAISDGTLGNPSGAVGGNKYNTRDIYSPNRNGNDWGYIGEGYTDGISPISTSGKPNFFRDIRITSMSQHKTATYILINPIISSYRGDTHDYSQGTGIMSTTMQLRYEAVKYEAGAIGADRPDTNIFGFADPAHYDTKKSPLTAGSTATVLGQGGLLDTGIGIARDLEEGNVLGAIQKAGAARQTFRNVNFRELARDEAVQLAKTTIRDQNQRKKLQNRITGVFFPTPKKG